MSYSDNYSYIDRVLHYMAFSVPKLQKLLSELDNDIFEKKIKNVSSSNEVFVTGLPRAGTTLILDLLYRTGEFATFTYRNMPFILAPLLWNKITGSFQKEGINKERAHGDGMEISFDSPEAFEEIIWIEYLRNIIINNNTISTLTYDDCTDEFAEVFKITIKKILFLESIKKGNTALPRYLSKNNANISRVDFISKLFPDSAILIPFRNPVNQVASLMKQHRQFSIMQEQDKFTRDYMKWLGHFEFGLNFKPINFNSWLGENKISSNIDANFWLQYWTNAYKYILSNKNENTYLINYDKLLIDPVNWLNKIAEFIHLDKKEKFINGAELIRSPTTSSKEMLNNSKSILEESFGVYHELESTSINY